MEDIILNVIFLTMFLVIIGCIIYFAYNYAEYKANVDESVFLTNRYINKVVMIFKDSINSTNRNLNTNVININKNISSVHDTLDESIKLTNINLLKLDENSTKYKNESNARLENLNKGLSDTNTKVGTIHSDVSSLKTFKEGTITEKNNLKTNLSKFFKFENGGKNVSDKIFEKIDYETEASNITLNSPIKSLSNISMCDTENKQCVNFGIADNNFNINTSTLNNINISDKAGNTLIKLNVDNKDIFLGGDNLNNAPLIIKDGKVYIKSLNVVKQDAQLLTLENINDNVSTLQ